MKILLGKLLIMLLVVQSMLTLLTYGSFKLNQEIISDILCINQEQPELLCNGKCYLASELMKQFEDSPDQDSSSNQQREVVHFLPKSVFEWASANDREENSQLRHYWKSSKLYKSSFEAEIPRPPWA